MLKIKKLKYSNILSVGNHPIEIDYEKNRNILIVGKNGSGKCVHPRTNITVKFDDPEVEKLFLGVETNIKNVYDFYKKYPEHKGKISVESRFGFYKILECEITAKNSEVKKVTTSKHKTLRCSPKHRVLGKDLKWFHIDDMSVGDFIFTYDGVEKIASIELEDEKCDLYDIQVDVVEEYYSNDIVSHNSTMTQGLIFALYGKDARGIKKNALINSINKKNLLVECEFSVDNVDYKVVRGIKPDIFEIYKNNILLGDHFYYHIFDGDDLSIEQSENESKPKKKSYMIQYDDHGKVISDKFI
jgi:hypothetical protein